MAERCLGFCINCGRIKLHMLIEIDVNWWPLMGLAAFDKDLLHVHGNVKFALKCNTGFGDFNCSEISRGLLALGGVS